MRLRTNIRCRRIAAAATATALLGSLAACASDDDDLADRVAVLESKMSGLDGSPTGASTTAPAAPSDLKGSILLDGSSTVGPLTEVAAELFMKANPGVRITVAVSGTSGGFQKFCSGETDGNSASRPIKEAEVTQCGDKGIAYEGVQVANDALSIVVHPDFPTDCITVDQAKQIWDDGSTVKNWDQVDGLDLPSESVALYGPGSDSGTFDFFTEAINGEEGRIRRDYNDIGEDDFAAVTAVEGNKWAMGYIPFSFVEEAGDKVKPLQIDGGEGCKEATLQNVLDGVYTPLGRPLFVYASDKALARPEVVAFFKFYIENSEEIAKAATFVPLNDAQKTESKAKVEDLAG